MCDAVIQRGHPDSVASCTPLPARARGIGSLLLVVTLLSVRGDFYLAPDGSDSNPGTKEKPFATLEAARDAIRKGKINVSPPAGSLTVWLRGGDYVRTNAFELTGVDSGSRGTSTIYRGYPGESPRLLGGIVLNSPGSARRDGFVPVTDPSVLARFDEKARRQVLQFDLRARGVTNVGQLKSRGFGRATTPAHSELFYDGRPMTLARWPNEGEWEKLAGFPETSSKNDDHGGNIGDLPGGFNYAGDRPRRWKDTSNLWVHGYWAWDWANSYERVELLDTDKRFIKTASPHGLYGFRKGQRFYFLNVLEELDQPGEWFLDREKGVLYFWPPDDQVPDREIVLSLLDQPLLNLNGASHLTFRGLILEASRGNAVEIRGGESNRVAGCRIRNIGDSGVVIEGGRNHGVVSCDIENTGDGGVSLNGGDRQTLTPGGHFVENCHFQKQGRWSKCYVPAVLVAGVGQRVSNNLIHDHPHSAMLFTGNEHLIEFNEIHHIALETGDVGAIYTGRDYSFRGNRIRHNFIHDTGGVGMGSMGVYMDDCVSGTEIYGNIFHKVQRAAFLGGGRDHRVENNIFVDCNPAVQLDGRGLDKSPVWHDMVYDFMKRQLAAVPQLLYRGRYPAIQDLDRHYAAREGIPPENNVVSRNICVGKWLEVGWQAKPEWLKLENNLVDADPGFVGQDGKDFRLRPDSPAWKLGFQPIPVEKIGLQDDEYRRDLKFLTAKRAT